MKKLLTLFTLFLSTNLAMCSSNSIPYSLEDSVHNYIDKNINTLSEEVLSYSLSNYETKGELTFFDITIDDKTQTIVYLDDLKKALDDFFKYNYFTATGDKLDYIYSSTYLSNELENVHLGDIYSPCANGKTIGTLVVSEIKEDYNVLSAMYIKNKYAGLKLEKRLGLNLNLDAYYSTAMQMGLRFKIKKSNWLYPFNPVASVRLHTNLRKVDCFLGLGLEYSLPLSIFANDSFTLLEDALLGASVILEINDKAEFASFYDISYQYYFTPSSSVILSYKADNKLTYYLSLGYGLLL